jgi:hypothetical protein
MSASMAELKLFLTGGALNASVPDSTGGVVSSTEILSQSTSSLSTLTGITINNATGNAEGDGTLAYNATAQTITWTPPSGTTGSAVDISSNGTFFVQGGSSGGALIITVVAASLPSSTTSNTVTVTNLSEKLFTNVSKDLSYAGVTRYHCFALKNTGTDAKKDVTIWIASNTPGQDTIAIGVANAAAGDGASTGIDTDTTDETVAPSSVTFTAPTTQATGLSVGDLSGSAGSTHTRCFWIKQLVPAGVDQEYLNNTFRIGISAKV